MNFQKIALSFTYLVGASIVLSMALSARADNPDNPVTPIPISPLTQPLAVFSEKAYAFDFHSFSSCTDFVLESHLDWIKVEGGQLIFTVPKEYSGTILTLPFTCARQYLVTGVNRLPDGRVIAESRPIFETSPSEFSIHVDQAFVPPTPIPQP